MTFDSRERSLATARPVRLYRFTRGTLSWAYCTADRDITFQAVKYAASAISDDGLRLTGEASADALKVTAPGTLAVAQLFRGAPPSSDVWLTIRDYHEGEPDAPASALISWIGTIAAVRWPATDRCEITCQTLSASMERPGLRLAWERTCPFALYDRNCRVNRELYRVDGLVQTVSGSTLGVPAAGTKPDGWFSGGFVAWVIEGGEIEQRGIESHAGIDLVLLGGTQGLRAAQSVAMYAGCNQTMAVCDGRFANGDNYGGYVDLPGKSAVYRTPLF